jgi:alpha-glucuronidase
MTFTNNPTFITSAKKIMMASREAVVNYMTPLGLHHLMGTGHHYGPAPWVDNLSRADWNPVYYHKADATGIGFERTSKGSNAVAQYAPTVASQFEAITTTPENLLLWFHHLPWNYTMKNGQSLWNELCRRYYAGVDSVSWMQKIWESLRATIDDERYQQVKMLLQVQEKEAIWWRNACLLYFQTFSRLPLPAGYEKPDQTLEYYKDLRFPFAPGN